VFPERSSGRGRGGCGVKLAVKDLGSYMTINNQELAENSKLIFLQKFIPNLSQFDILASILFSFFSF
jgi:hypothetical protein